MKFRNLASITVVIIILMTSCYSLIEDFMGNWEDKGSYEGVARGYGTCFEIDNIGYYGMGRNDDSDYLTDFWKYDPSTNIWTEVAEFPGTPRAYGVSVSNGKFGFAGLGYDGDDDLSDFWKYDPSSNTWTQIEDFPGGERRYASAFSIGDNIYVGLGTSDKDDVYHNDIYKYDGVEWTKVASLDEKLKSAITVAMDGEAYVLGGYHSTIKNDFYKYSPESNSWTQLMDVDEDNYGDSDIPRQSANAFTVDGKIYVVFGNDGTSAKSSCYEWHPGSDEWIKKTSANNARFGAGCFVLNDQPYVVGGSSSSSNYFDDLQIFYPNVENDNDDDE